MDGEELFKALDDDEAVTVMLEFETHKRDIVNLDIYKEDPEILMLGMLCTNISSAIWLHLASYLKMPVSTTHSIIGAIVGFSLAYGGSNSIKWDGIGKIVLSWFISPILSGVFSILLYTIMKYFVFKKENPFERTLKIFPLLTFFTFLINKFFIFYKGTPQLKLDKLPIWITIVTSLSIASTTSLIAWYIYVPYKRKLILN